MTDFVETSIPGVILIEPPVHRDDRGYFLETYHESRYRDGGIRERFVQDNQSSSVRNTLRGFHGQSPHPQGKLVRVIEGEIFDVAVDVRRGSPAYGKHFAARLSAQNFRQLYLPKKRVYNTVADIPHPPYRTEANRSRLRPDYAPEHLMGHRRGYASGYVGLHTTGNAGNR